MFRFADPEYLYLLFIVPVLILMYLYTGWKARKRMNQYGEWRLLSALMPDRSMGRPWLKFILLVTAFSFLVVMIARPQMGQSTTKDSKTGIEVVIALDVSNSMLAQDVSPNRMERAKLLISNLVDKMENDKVGMDVFAGDAFVQLPITNDFVSAKMFLDQINPGMVTTQGTDLGAAIDLASRSFTQTKGVGRAILVITDGEGHEAGAEEAATRAAKDGKNVYVLGIGSTKGAVIPMAGGQTMRDGSGQEVMTRLDENMCRQLAAAGKGAYLHIDNSMAAQDQLFVYLNQLQKKDLSTASYADYDEQFQAFALLALLLLIIEVCIVEVKSPFIKRLNLFRR